MSEHTPTASQTVGPFFSIGLSALCRQEIACGAATGERVKIRGRVLDGNGEPVPDAVLEIWHAAAGTDTQIQSETRTTVGQSENIPAGFARIPTNDHGEFEFTTYKPLVRRDADGNVHAPHLFVVLLMRGLLRHLVTRIYFADDDANGEDVVLKLVPADRRETLLAKQSLSGGTNEFLWDVHLQGENETVFFDV